MGPRISVLVATSDRRDAFHPWLAWNLRKQTLRGFEVLALDDHGASTVDRDVYWRTLSEQADTRIRPIYFDRDATIGTKKNVGITAARNHYIASADDDDWQHPERLAKLVRAAGDEVVVGWNTGVFYDLETNRVRRYTGPRGMLATVLVTRAMAEAVVYTNHKHASTTDWVQRLIRRYGAEELPLCLHGFWIRHHDNLSRNRRIRWEAGDGRATLEQLAGSAWQDTDLHLDALRTRLEWSRTCRRK